MCMCLCVGRSFSFVCIYRVQYLLNVQRENDPIRFKAGKTKALQDAQKERIQYGSLLTTFHSLSINLSIARFYETNCINSPLVMMWFAIWWCMLQSLRSSNFIATSAYSIKLHDFNESLFFPLVTFTFILCRKTMEFLKIYLSFLKKQEHETMVKKPTQKRVQNRKKEWTKNDWYFGISSSVVRGWNPKPRSWNEWE